MSLAMAGLLAALPTTALVAFGLSNTGNRGCCHLEQLDSEQAGAAAACPSTAGQRHRAFRTVLWMD